jgi:hypothetical protein
MGELHSVAPSPKQLCAKLSKSHAEHPTARQRHYEHLPRLSTDHTIESPGYPGRFRVQAIPTLRMLHVTIARGIMEGPSVVVGKKRPEWVGLT